MAQSFAAHHYHIVFSTKDRRPAISDPPTMWRYLAGIAKRIECLPMAIGGVKDHVHLLIFVPGDIAVATVVSRLKANSSKWMGKAFAWQRGYASFTVSASNLKSVTEYIETQPEHHKKRSFQEEYLALLRKHGVEYDPRYVFD
jgi:putative transposase